MSWPKKYATSTEHAAMRPEWDRLKTAGWRFVYDTETRFLGCEHPDGGKFSIAQFEFQAGDRETLAHQIGHTMATFLND